MQGQNDDASAMLRGMLNIGGSAPAAPAPSAQQLAAQQLAAAQQQLAELEAKHGKIQEAFAQMHTVPPEQQPGVQQQLLASRFCTPRGTWICSVFAACSLLPQLVRLSLLPQDAQHRSRVP